MHLATLYEADDNGRLTATREPARQPAPMFVLVRSATSSASLAVARKLGLVAYASTWSIA